MRACAPSSSCCFRPLAMPRQAVDLRMVSVTRQSRQRRACLDSFQDRLYNLIHRPSAFWFFFFHSSAQHIDSISTLFALLLHITFCFIHTALMHAHNSFHLPRSFMSLLVSDLDRALVQHTFIVNKFILPPLSNHNLSTTTSSTHTFIDDHPHSPFILLFFEASDC